MVSVWGMFGVGFFWIVVIIFILMVMIIVMKLFMKFGRVGGV